MECSGPGADEEAEKILRDMRRRAGTLFRALDADEDGMLSPSEIAEAPETLRALDMDGDGYLREEDIGGPTLIPGLVRRSGIVRLLDEDGDLVIGPNDIADAAERIRRLDTDGDGFVTAEDDLPPPGANVENRLPMGTPAQNLAYQRKMFTRSHESTGPLPPSGRPDVQPGFLLIHEVSDRSDVQKSNRTFLMDEHGAIAHVWRSRRRLTEGTVSYLLPNGNLLRTTCERDWLEMDGQFPIGTHGTVGLEAKDGTILWEWTCLDFEGEALHHDVEMMPNGNILAICWQPLAARDACEMGWIPQGARSRVIFDKLYEIKPDFETGGAEIVWEWSAADHVVQNADPSAPCFGDSAEHPERIDINWPILDRIQFNSGQLFHLNSVSYNANQDVILLSSAAFGEIWMIDHSTSSQEAAGSSGGRFGRGGDIIWRWGNPQTQGLGAPDDQILYWQHDAHFMSGEVPREGDVLLFNNGMRRSAEGRADHGQICMGMVSGAYSDVLELKLPRNLDGGIAAGKDPEIVWKHNGDGRSGFYSPFMSGAQRMPNGNTLMVQACDKRVVEVSPDGRTLMDFRVGGPGRMFRIYKYLPDHPGIGALGL